MRAQTTISIRHQPVAHSGEQAAQRARWHVLLATWLGELFDGMDASIYVLVLFPAVSELIGTSSHAIVGQYGSVILAIFMIGWAFGAMVFGTMADYIGRAKTMIITILIYALASGLCAFSQNWWQLALFRFLVGCGIGGEISIGGVMISEYWRGRSRLHAIAALNTSFGCGYLLAALFNLVFGQLGWRWLFVLGVAPALVTLYIRSKLKEPEQFTAVQRLKRQLRKTPGTQLSEEHSELVRFTFPTLFAADHRFKVLIVIALASTAIVGYWAVLSWIPAWINQLTGTKAVLERSQAAIVMNIGSIIACAFGGAVINRLGRSRALRLSYSCALFCCATMFLTVKAFGVALLGWVFLVGGFASFPFVVTFTYVPELFPAHIRATAFGFSVQFGRLVAAAAAIAGGQIIATFNGSYAIAGATVSLIYTIGILATFFMPKTSGEVELGVKLASAADLQPEPIV